MHRAWLLAAALVGAIARQCDEASGCLCRDDRAVCRFLDDGECDDGGPGSDSGHCHLGTDCADCGERRDGHGGSFLCKNRCGVNNNDGVCDDGGPGSRWRPGRCDLGHDCDDCGMRLMEDVCMNDQMVMCHDSCSFAKDGSCDDGGPGQLTHQCSLGTDCSDCGERIQSCGAGAEDEPAPTYSYDDANIVATPQHNCHGAFEPRCDAKVCKRWMRPDCTSCQCSLCDFCKAPEEPSVGWGWALVPPPPAPMPPPQPITCDMLAGRVNLQQNPSDAVFCYVVGDRATCDRSYTYNPHAAGGPDLRLCHTRSDGTCGSWPVDASDIASADCQRWLYMPPPSPMPPPPPSPTPLSPPPSPSAPPSPPAPPPCLPPSAKCAGEGWTGLTKCCNDGDWRKGTRCYKRNDRVSQCKSTCPPEWDCFKLPCQGAAFCPFAPQPTVDSGVQHSGVQHDSVTKMPPAVVTKIPPAVVTKIPPAVGLPTPSPSPIESAAPIDSFIDDVEQALEAPPAAPSPPSWEFVSSEEQQEVRTESKPVGGTGPIHRRSWSYMGLMATVTIALLVALCVVLLCRRWAKRGAELKRGKRLRDGATSEAGDWAAGDGPSMEMLHAAELDGDRPICDSPQRWQRYPLARQPSTLSEARRYDGIN